MVENAKSAYLQWLKVHCNMERSAKFGIGNKIDTIFIDLLELLRKATYAPIDKKLVILTYASDKVDGLRFFLQLLWEARLMHHEKYVALASATETIGRNIGGWRKGLANKTSAQKAEEIKE